MDPFQSPVATQDVALVEVHESVADPPSFTVTGPFVPLTFKSTVGSGPVVGVGAGVGEATPELNINEMPLAAQNQSLVLVQLKGVVLEVDLRAPI